MVVKERRSVYEALDSHSRGRGRGNLVLIRMLQFIEIVRSESRSALNCFDVC